MMSKGGGEGEQPPKHHNPAPDDPSTSILEIQTQMWSQNKVWLISVNYNFNITTTFIYNSLTN